MFRKTKLYPCMAVVLAVICVIFLSNCGGGGNSAVVPNTNPTTENPVSYTNPTPTPVLSNVNVSGYLYVNNTVTEDGETIPSISVLDVPACQSDSSGNESFLTQFSNSIKTDYPEDWAKADVQELYAQLNKTLSESKPLPEYNAQAQLCSAYDDTSIPVGNDGHFDNTVLTGAADSNIKLEVALGEDNYAEVETLPSSGSINSSDATSAAVLKSCPKKIFAFPGEIIIFKVYAEPGINLKSAGLRFTLNNASIGCITQPVYLCLFGAHKYQVAYGCVYIKPGLDTPVDTTITAKLNSEQSMSIFLEVIKKTASVSGTVYTGESTLVKGYVKSLGPKACSKIDNSGQYRLPRVFMGHSRSVIATWWTSENGQKVRHREEKVIDFLNSDLTGFNFGVPPTPTPTLTPTATPTPRDLSDPFYARQSLKIMDQFEQWKEEFGIKDAAQKTVDWLDNKLNEPPLPECIAGGEIWDGFGPNPVVMIYFDGGGSIGFPTGDDCFGSYPNNNNIEITNDIIIEKNQSNFTKISSQETFNSKAVCFEPSDIYLISPFEWQAIRPKNISTDLIVKALTDAGYTTHSKITNSSDLKFLRIEDSWDEAKKHNVYVFKADSLDNIPIPGNYGAIGQCGLTYIFTHSSDRAIVACPLVVVGEERAFDDDLELFQKEFESDCYDKIKNTNGFWGYMWIPIDPVRQYFPDVPVKDNGKKNMILTIYLLSNFFDNFNNDIRPEYNFKNSVIYINGCHSAYLKDSFSSAKIYIGNNNDCDMWWAKSMGYYFFRYMLYGVEPPKDVPGYIPSIVYNPPIEPGQPMHVNQAIEMLTLYRVNPDPQTYRDTTNTVGIVLPKSDCRLVPVFKGADPNTEDEVYFPVNVPVTVHKK